MPLRTPDGRYNIVRGRLWRAANPNLSEAEQQRLVQALMDARRAVKAARAEEDSEAEDAAHQAVDAAKHALGERGPVWWADGAPDLNRKMVRNTGYAAWYDGLTEEERDGGWGGLTDPAQRNTSPAHTQQPAGSDVSDLGVCRILCKLEDVKGLTRLTGPNCGLGIIPCSHRVPDA